MAKRAMLGTVSTKALRVVRDPIFGKSAREMDRGVRRCRSDL